VIAFGALSGYKFAMGISLDLPEDLKQRAEDAARLRGESLDTFIAGAVAEATDRVFDATERVIKLSEAGARELLELMENPPEPSRELRELFRNHKRISREQA
jgi:uncharacterized protein (DUF1778 family)